MGSLLPPARPRRRALQPLPPPAVSVRPPSPPHPPPPPPAAAAVRPPGPPAVASLPRPLREGEDTGGLETWCLISGCQSLTACELTSGGRFSFSPRDFRLVFGWRSYFFALFPIWVRCMFNTDQEETLSLPENKDLSFLFPHVTLGDFKMLLAL